MLHKDEILELADYIEGNDIKFDMMYVDSCIIGHAANLWDLHDRVGLYPATELVARKLGLNREQVQDLFYPECLAFRFPPDRADAITALRNLAETSRVEWNAARHARLEGELDELELEDA